MKRIALALVMGPALALAACGDAGGDSAGEGDAVAAAPRPSLNLDATGITIPPQNGKDLYTVPFGSNRAATEDTLAAALGSIKSRETTTGCPAGPVSTTTYDGITLAFQKDSFVGWFAVGGDYLPDLSRKEIAGSSADPLTKVEDSTLGEEYFLGAQEGPVISFIFTDAGGDARPESMWAGTNCIFR